MIKMNISFKTKENNKKRPHYNINNPTTLHNKTIGNLQLHTGTLHITHCDEVKIESIKMCTQFVSEDQSL